MRSLPANSPQSQNNRLFSSHVSRLLHSCLQQRRTTRTTLDRLVSAEQRLLHPRGRQVERDGQESDQIDRRLFRQRIRGYQARERRLRGFLPAASGHQLHERSAQLEQSHRSAREPDGQTGDQLEVIVFI